MLKFLPDAFITILERDPIITGSSSATPSVPTISPTTKFPDTELKNKTSIILPLMFLLANPSTIAVEPEDAPLSCLPIKVFVLSFGLSSTY